MLKDQCFLIRKPTDGGGNVHSSTKIIVRRVAAIGDVCAATVVADRLAEKGFETEFQSHIGIHCALRYIPNVSSITEPGGFAHINLDGAYEQNPSRRTLHFSEMFMAKADEAMRPYGIQLGQALNCRPRIILPRHITEAAKEKFKQYPKPWVFCVPRSNTYNVRQVPDNVWEGAAPRIEGTKFWVGTTGAPKGFVDLQARHLDNVIAWLSAADLLVSVDTGPAHIGIALGIQTVMLGQSSSPDLHFSDQRDFETIWPEGNLNCLNCQQNLCRIDHYMPPCQRFNVEELAAKANKKIIAYRNNDVSAAIAIYRPEYQTLNRCLECLIPQVQEIVVCVDQAGIIPEGALKHEKIRYVRHRQFNVGYGRKMNVATRCTSGRYVLQINDDVFLNPDAVQKMRDCMKPGIGIVSCLLRYPDGTIQHAGKIRSPGVRGWAHRNHKQHIADIKEPEEQENTCGACWLVDRKAHFDAGGYDERFVIYSEDDAFCLQVRKCGYKIMFTPHATGIHLEHQSTMKTGPIIDYLNASNKIFHETWGKYLDANLHKIPGDFSYCQP